MNTNTLKILLKYKVSCRNDSMVIVPNLLSLRTVVHGLKLQHPYEYEWQRFCPRNHCHLNVGCQLLLKYITMWIMCIRASMQLHCIVSCQQYVLIILWVTPFVTVRLYINIHLRQRFSQCTKFYKLVSFCQHAEKLVSTQFILWNLQIVTHHSICAPAELHLKA